MVTGTRTSSTLASQSGPFPVTPKVIRTVLSRVQGVVAGSTDGNLTMEFVEGTADVNAGDLVLTSGIGGSYPPGEVIGKVTNVERTAQELFQSVRVEPLAALERLESVLVLTSFVPQQGAAP